MIVLLFLNLKKVYYGSYLLINGCQKLLYSMLLFQKSKLLS